MRHSKAFIDGRIDDHALKPAEPLQQPVLQLPHMSEESSPAHRWRDASPWPSRRYTVRSPFRNEVPLPDRRRRSADRYRGSLSCTGCRSPWFAEFVRCEADEIETQLLRPHRDLAEGLHRIDMELHFRILFHISPILAIGWIVPISLFTCIMLTRIVSSRIAFSTCSG